MVVSSALLQANKRLLEQRGKLQVASCKEKLPVFDPIMVSSISSVREERRNATFVLKILKDEPKECSNNCLSTPDILIHGEMAAAVLREGYVGAARIWWLLRNIDATGRGCFKKEIVKENLAGQVGGWRRIRQLLCEGDGLFWKWDGERVWLRSVAKVAVELGIVRFSADPIPLPSEKLFGRITQVKANLYAIFHSTRDETPIARETLRDVTGISASSQRSYEEQAGIRSKAQYALLAQNLKEAAWQHGHAVFAFIDHLGKHGKAGQRWTARQLPNCYSASFEPREHKNSRRRLNRKLADLLKQGTTGNDWQTFEQVYYAKVVGEDGYFRGVTGMWYEQKSTARLFSKVANSTISVGK